MIRFGINIWAEYFYTVFVKQAHHHLFHQYNQKAISFANMV